MATRLYGLPSELVPVQPYTPPADEFECCNLTITVPAPSSLPSDEPMPVMVWIHGGGNVTGSGNEWVWDMGALVKKSIEVGKPIVAVALKCVYSCLYCGRSSVSPDLMRMICELVDAMTNTEYCFSVFVWVFSALVPVTSCARTTTRLGRMA